MRVMIGSVLITGFSLGLTLVTRVNPMSTTRAFVTFKGLHFLEKKKLSECMHKMVQLVNLIHNIIHDKFP